jgi:hypothetical protein
MACGGLCWGATTWHVPGDFATIQAAIDAASPGDTIRVGPGTYVGTVRFNGKWVSVQSTHGPEATTLDGNGATVVGIGPGGEIMGFTITGATAYYSGAVETHGIGSLIKGNIVEGNGSHAPVSAGVEGNNASPIIEGNIFRYNTSDLQYSSGVLCFVNGSSPRIVNNILVDNSCRAISLTLPAGTRAEVVNNTVLRNQTGFLVTGGPHVLRNNIVVDNQIGAEGGLGSGGDDTVWHNNLVYGNGVNYAGTPDLTGLCGNLCADPRFVDPMGDYRLTVSCHRHRLARRRPRRGSAGPTSPGGRESGRIC